MILYIAHIQRTVLLRIDCRSRFTGKDKQDMIKVVRKINKITGHSYSNHFFSSQIGSMSSTQDSYTARFIPTLTESAKVIIPISMTRYDGDSVKKKHYDQEITSLLTYTANSLDRNALARVDIISTSGLQKINWDSEKADQIEEHFMSTHKVMLSKQSNVYTWDDLITKLGDLKYSNNYELVKSASETKSTWHELMLKTGKSIDVNSSIEKSLEYQRREYAAILSMSSIYSHIAYMGKPSPAWSYLYQKYDGLPLFTRIVIDKIKNKSRITATDVNACTNMIFNNIEGILVNENFSIQDKNRLADMVLNLFRTYLPKEIKAEESTSADASDVTNSTEVDDSKRPKA